MSPLSDHQGRCHWGTPTLKYLHTSHLFLFIHTSILYVPLEAQEHREKKTLLPFFYLIFLNLFLISFSLIWIFAFCIWCRSIISSPTNIQKKSSYRTVSLWRENTSEISDHLPWLHISAKVWNYFENLHTKSCSSLSIFETSTTS